MLTWGSSDIVVSHIICITLAGLAVVLRFISRRVCRAAILADDYLIIAALIFAAGEVTGGLLCKSSIIGDLPDKTHLLTYAFPCK